MGELAVALWPANADIGNVYDQSRRFLGILTGVLGSLVFMGIFMKRGNGFGTTCGLVANCAVCFTLDPVPFAGRPHLLLFGILGMLACLSVAPIASRAACKIERWTLRHCRRGGDRGCDPTTEELELNVSIVNVGAVAPQEVSK